MLVEAGRHENPKLRRDGGKAQAKAAEHADLHLGEEHFVQRGIDQVIVGLALKACAAARSGTGRSAWKKRSRPRNRCRTTPSPRPAVCAARPDAPSAAPAWRSAPLRLRPSARSRLRPSAGQSRSRPAAGACDTRGSAPAVRRSGAAAAEVPVRRAASVLAACGGCRGASAGFRRLGIDRIEGALDDRCSMSALRSAIGSVERSFSTSARNSSSSLCRAMSSKLFLNSLAMLRALPAQRPAMFIRRGKSFGPTTTSATVSRMRIWLQLKRSNILGHPRSRSYQRSFRGRAAILLLSGVL